MHRVAPHPPNAAMASVGTLPEFVIALHEDRPRSRRFPRSQANHQSPSFDGRIRNITLHTHRTPGQREQFVMPDGYSADQAKTSRGRTQNDLLMTFLALSASGQRPFGAGQQQSALVRVYTPGANTRFAGCPSEVHAPRASTNVRPRRSVERSRFLRTRFLRTRFPARTLSRAELRLRSRRGRR